MVGGISRTVERDGWRFDIGGHRFFTKVQAVEDLWHEILDDDEFLQRPRKSHIYYRGKFYDYPLKPFNALRNLGPLEAVRCVASALWVRMRPPKDRSARGLRRRQPSAGASTTTSSRPTARSCGVVPSQIAADWGAQRIKGLSLFQAVWEPIRSRAMPGQGQGQAVTSLIEEFQYRCTARHDVGALPGAGRGRRHQGHPGHAGDPHPPDGAGRSAWWPSRRASPTESRRSRGLVDAVRAAAAAMDPPVPDDVRRAADGLEFRDFLTVALVVPADKVGWTTTGSTSTHPRSRRPGAELRVVVALHGEGRATTCWGSSTPCARATNRGPPATPSWSPQAAKELETIGLMRAADVEAGYVVRMPKAYPVYDADYQANVEVLRAWLAEHAPNVHPIGRNGMHRYNNQDHSMFTAVLTVENIVAGTAHDIWNVNVEDEYHEEKVAASGTRGTGRDAPILPRSADRQAPTRRDRWHTRQRFRTSRPPRRWRMGPLAHLWCAGSFSSPSSRSSGGRSTC